jgi:hypothetical protein
MFLAVTVMILLCVVLPLGAAIYTSRKSIKRDLEELEILEKLKGPGI